MFDRLTRLDLSFSKFTRLQSFRLFAVVALMISQSWMLTAWIVIFLSVGAVAARLGGNLIERLCASTRQRITQLQGHLVEYLSCMLLAARQRLLKRILFKQP